MLVLKYLHVTFAVVSLCGFVLRWAWSMRRSAGPSGRLVRTAPHVVDTGLFLTGVAMVWAYHWNPLEVPWLLAKLTALLAYIGFGALALSRRPCAGPRRLAAFVGAAGAAGFIVAAALTKRAWPLWS